MKRREVLTRSLTMLLWSTCHSLSVFLTDERRGRVSVPSSSTPHLRPGPALVAAVFTFATSNGHRFSQNPGRFDIAYGIYSVVNKMMLAHPFFFFQLQEFKRWLNAFPATAKLTFTISIVPSALPNANAFE